MTRFESFDLEYLLIPLPMFISLKKAASQDYVRVIYRCDLASMHCSFLSMVSYYHILYSLSENCFRPSTISASVTRDDVTFTKLALHSSSVLAWCIQNILLDYIKKRSLLSGWLGSLNILLALFLQHLVWMSGPRLNKPLLGWSLVRSCFHTRQ